MSLVTSFDGATMVGKTANETLAELLTEKDIARQGCGSSEEEVVAVEQRHGLPAWAWRVRRADCFELAEFFEPGLAMQPAL